VAATTISVSYFGNSNSMVIGGTDMAGNPATVKGNLTLGGTGNWVRVDAGGVLTNGSVTLSGSGLVFTNGGDVYVSGVNLANNDSQWVFNGGTLHATANGAILNGNGIGILGGMGGTIDDGGRPSPWHRSCRGQGR
jgi:hypothetical protein